MEYMIIFVVSTLSFSVGYWLGSDRLPSPHKETCLMENPTWLIRSMKESKRRRKGR